MKVELPWEFGQILYLRVASERRKGMVTGYFVYGSGLAVSVTWPDRTETRHYPFELTAEYVPDYES